jgi:hypothetical protein
MINESRKYSWTERPSTDTTGREQNLAEAPDILTTQACVDTNAPLLSAALCSALDSTVDAEGEELGRRGVLPEAVKMINVDGWLYRPECWLNISQNNGLT